MRVYSIIASVFTIALGLLVIAGWVFGWEAVVRIHPTFGPMQFNTALGFVLVGLSMVGLRIRSRTLTIIPSALAILLGSITIIQYVYSLNLGIDELFVRADIGVEPAHPGRMAANTAICFALLGSSAVITAVYGWRARWPYILAGIVALLGTLSLWGYLARVPETYGWLSYSRMALHTSLGFVVAGLGIYIYAFLDSFEGRPIRQALFIPASAFITISAAALYLSQAIIGEEQNTMYRYTQSQCKQASEYAQVSINRYIHATERAAHRPVNDLEEWKADTLRDIHDYPGLDMVQWIDQRGDPRLAVSARLSENDRNRLSEIILAHLDESDQVGADTTVAGTIALDERGKFLWLWVPMESRNASHGHLLSIIDPGVLLENAFSLTDYQHNIVVREGDDVLFWLGEMPGAVDDGSQSSRQIAVGGLDWEIELWASPALIKSSTSVWGTAVLYIGILIAAAIALLALLLVLGNRAREFQRVLFNEIRLQKNALDEHAIVAITDPRGVITYVNDKFCQISKYSAEELIGRTHRVINSGFHPKEFFEDMWGTIKSGSVWHGEVCNKAKDGSLYWVDTTIVPFRSPENEITRYVAIRNDVTQILEAEQQLAQANKELNLSNGEMEEFVYTVSHDLKSPLVTIQGYSGAIQKDIKSDRYDRVDRFADQIVNAAARMCVTIADLLELSQAGRGEHLPTRVDSGEVVRDVLDQLRTQIEEKHALIELDDDMPVILADRVRAVQVFQNLIANALKYGCPGDRQCVIRIGGKKNETETSVYVSDNGPGIDARYQAKIFGLFQRLSNEPGGTGIGLAIVHRIATVHGGRAWVESSPGNGSTFYVSFAENQESASSGSHPFSDACREPQEQRAVSD